MADADIPPSPPVVVGMDKLVKEVLADIKARGSEPELPTGLARLDEAIWGLHRTEVTVLAARPGEGKTTMALQMAGHLADRKKRVLFLSLEMNVHQIVERWLIQLTHTNAWDLRTGTSTQAFCEKVETLDGYFTELSLRCLDDEGITVSEITNLLNEMAKTNAPPEVLFIDFIQLIEAEQDGVSDMEAIKQYLRALKRLAKRYNIAVVICSQINREGGRSGKLAPKLIHLKGCVHGSMLVNGCRMRDIVKQQQLMRVKCLDLRTGQSHWLKPVRYLVSGLKQCFEIRTAQGKRLIASDETKVYTPQGWKRLDTLSVGDKIVIEERADTQMENHYDKPKKNRQVVIPKRSCRME